ncbi:MAG: IPT/TIG domain-containing protein [Candidatus Nomurabacteria bacterium]|nr:IPT/TIG domain-containing protein [Candidatus Nomurabacteria bacterium]
MLKKIVIVPLLAVGLLAVSNTAISLPVSAATESETQNITVNVLDADGDLNPKTVEDDEEVHLYYCNFDNDEDVRVTQTEFGVDTMIKADDAGCIDFYWKIPGDAPPGEYIMKFTGQTSGHEEIWKFRVVAKPTPAPTPLTPNTGILEFFTHKVDFIGRSVPIYALLSIGLVGLLLICIFIWLIRRRIKNHGLRRAIIKSNDKYQKHGKNFDFAMFKKHEGDDRTEILDVNKLAEERIKRDLDNKHTEILDVDKVIKKHKLRRVAFQITPAILVPLVAAGIIHTVFPPSYAASNELSISLAQQNITVNVRKGEASTKQSTTASQVTVNSGATSGYNLWIEAESGNDINRTIGTMTFPSVLDANSWGFALKSGDTTIANGFDSDYSVGTDTATTGRYAGIESSDGQMQIKHYSTIVSGDVTTVYVAVNVNDSMPSGVYHASLVYYAENDTFPTVGAITPNVGPTAGGNIVTITGANLTSDTDVAIGGVACGSMNFISDTELECTAPANPAGDNSSVDVMIHNDSGTTVISNGYTYLVTPTLTSVSPPTVNADGQAHFVTIHGTNFDIIGSPNTTRVTIGAGSPGTDPVCEYGSSFPGTSIVKDSETSNAYTIVCQITTTQGDLGAKQVIVTTSGGQTSSKNIIYVDFKDIEGDIEEDDGVIKCVDEDGCKIIFDNGTEVDVPKDGTIETDPNGDVIITPKPGDNAKVSFPCENGYIIAPKVIVKADGTLEFPNGGTMTVTRTDNDVTTVVGTVNLPNETIIAAQTIPTNCSISTDSQGQGLDFVTPDGTISTDTVMDIDDDGSSVTLPDGGTLTNGDNEITIGPGGNVQIEDDGSFTLPDGGTVGPIEIEDGSNIKFNDDGTVTIKDGCVTSADGTQYCPASGGSVTISPSLPLPNGGGEITFGDAGGASSGTVIFPNGEDMYMPIGGGTIDVDQDLNPNLPALVYTSITPNVGVAGTTVAITGSGFIDDNGNVLVTSVTIGGATTGCDLGSITATSLSCTTPTGLAAGAQMVVVNTYVDSEDSGSDNAKKFTYQDALKSADVTLSPNYGPAIGGNSVVANGTGASFTNGSTHASIVTSVVFNNVTIPVGTSGTSPYYAITASAGVPDLPTTPNDQITIYNVPAGTGMQNVVITTSTGSATKSYQYIDSPTISSVARTDGGNSGYLKVSDGSTVVTVAGSGFVGTALGGTTVLVGGNTCTVDYATNFSDVSLQCSIGTHEAGLVDATVQTVNNIGAVPVSGSAFLGSAIEYLAAPTFTSISANYGTMLGGNQATITGTGFCDAAGTSVISAAINGHAASISIPVDCGAGTVGVTVPAYATSEANPANVVLSSPGGDSGSGGNASYSYVDDPTITSLSPSHGKTGDQVEINGANFMFNSSSIVTKITIDGTDYTTGYVVENGKVTVTNMPSGSGTVAISVTTSIGTSASAYFTYLPAPTVTSVETANDNYIKVSDSSTQLTIIGTNFVEEASGYGGNVVKLSSNSSDFSLATNCSIANASADVTTTSITCTVQQSLAAGTYYVQVTNAGGGSNTDTIVESLVAPGTLSLNPSSVRYNDATIFITLTDAANSLQDSVGNNVVKEFKVNNAENTTFDVTSAGTLTFTVPTDLSITTDINVTVSLETYGGGPSTTDLTYIAPPVINLNGLSAIAGKAGDILTVTGSNFNNISDAALGYPINEPSGPPSTGVPAYVANATLVFVEKEDFDPITSPNGTYTVDSDTQIRIKMPTVDNIGIFLNEPYHIIFVRTKNSVATMATSIQEFTYADAPVLNPVTRNYHQVNTADEVTVSGSNLNGATVIINSLNATDVSVTGGGTNLSFKLPLGLTAGDYDIVVNAYGGQVSTTNTPVIVVDPPTITDVSPIAGSVGSGTVITITGSNFVPNWTTVTIGTGECINPTVVDSATVTCNAPTSILAAGEQTVRVETLGGTNNYYAVTQPGGGFYYIDDPTISTISPISGPSAGGQTVTITGTNFTRLDTHVSIITSVTFGGTAATVTGVTDTTITVTTPSHTAGLVNVSVSTIADTITKPNGYTYLAPPTITSISPTSGSIYGNTHVEIAGTNFDTTGSTVVKIDDATLTCSTITATSAACVTGAHAKAAGVPVTLSTSAGNASGTVTFDFVDTAGTWSISPNEGPLTGGTTVTLTGNIGASAGNTTVTIDGISATGVTVNSANEVVFTTPANTTVGWKEVIVTTPAGSYPESSTSGFYYVDTGSINPVEIDASTAAYGPLTGGNVITIDGTGFDATAEITDAYNLQIDGNSCVISGVTTTQITCTVPAGNSVGVKNVTLAVAGVSITTLTGAYTYLPAPTITTINENYDKTAGGKKVTVTGTNFQTAAFGGTTILLGGNACVVDYANGFSATTLDCTVPASSASAITTVGLEIQTAGGSATKNDAFTYVPTPTVTGAERVTRNGGTDYIKTSESNVPMIIKGTNFAAASIGDTTVSIGGSACSGALVTDNTTITCNAPQLPAGAQSVVATNISGSSTVNGTAEYLAAPGTISFDGSGSYSISASSSGLYLTLYEGNAVLKNSSGSSVVSQLKVGDDLISTGDMTVLTDEAGEGRLYFLVPELSAGSYTVSLSTYGGGPVTTTLNYVDAPTVTKVGQSSNINVPYGKAGDTFTVQGSNFFFGGSSIVSKVEVGGVEVSSANYTVTATDSITVTLPAAVDGQQLVKVYTTKDSLVSDSGDTSTLGTSAVWYAPAPTVTAMNGQTNGANITYSSASGVNITGASLTGTNFKVNSVDIVKGVKVDGSINATAWTTATDGSITGITIPVGSGLAAGSHTVAVETYGGTSGTFTFYTIDVPTITEVSPTYGAPTGQTLITVTGTNFKNAAGTFVVSSVVLDSGGTAANCTSPAVTTDDSGNHRLTCTTTGHDAGAVKISVTNPAGTGTSNNAIYTYASTTVTSLTKNYGKTGDTVVITGAHFDGTTGADAVKFGTVNATSYTVNSDTQITATVPTGTGTVHVTVTNYGTSTTNTNTRYTYLAAPTIDSVSPNYIKSSDATTQLTINGANFVTGSTYGDNEVKISSNSSDFSAALNCSLPTDTSSTIITCTAPNLTTAGVYYIQVTNAGGTSNVDKTVESLSAPVYSSISPTYGITTGSSVTITASNLRNVGGSSVVSAVTIGGAACTSINVTSGTQLTCNAPASTAGSKDVVITTYGGQTTGTNAYTYVAAPTVTQAYKSDETSVTYGKAGTSFEIIGTGFKVGATNLVKGITIGDVDLPVDTYSVTSDTVISVVLPPQSNLSNPVKNIIVTTTINSTDYSSTSTATVGTDAVLYIPAPTISSIVTSRSNNNIYLKAYTSYSDEEQTVTITGENLDVTGGTTITIAGQACTSPTIVPTNIICTAPNLENTVGLQDVIVTTVGGSASTKADYLYAPDNLVVNVSGLPVTSMTIAGGPISLTGDNLQDHAATPNWVITQVMFDSTTLCNNATPDPNCNSNGVALPSSTPGNHTVTIHTPVGSASVQILYTYPATVTKTCQSTGACPESPETDRQAYGKAGDSFEITGTNFEYCDSTCTSYVTGVTVGGTAVGTYTITGPTKISIVLPSGPAAGLQNVTVTTDVPGTGSSTTVSSGALGTDAVYYVDTVTQAPTITDMKLNDVSTTIFGSAHATSDVSVTGANYCVGSTGIIKSVTIRTADKPDVSVDSYALSGDCNSITGIVIPANDGSDNFPAGDHTLVVTTYGGEATIDFITVSAPAVISINPPSAPITGDSDAGAADIAGDNFMTYSSTDLVHQVIFDPCANYGYADPADSSCNSGQTPVETASHSSNSILTLSSDIPAHTDTGSVRIAITSITGDIAVSGTDIFIYEAAMAPCKNAGTNDSLDPTDDSTCAIDIDANMIPVVYDTDANSWRQLDFSNDDTDQHDGSWYDYQQQKWANTVTLYDDWSKVPYDDAYSMCEYMLAYQSGLYVSITETGNWAYNSGLTECATDPANNLAKFNVSGQTAATPTEFVTFVENNGNHDDGTPSMPMEDLAVAHWVYVPRYAYNVQRRDAVDQPSCYEGTTSGTGNARTCSDSTQVRYDIAFETTEMPTNSPQPTCSTSTNFQKYADCVSDVKPSGDGASDHDNSSWATHPAFTYDGKELNGLWMGKFETGTDFYCVGNTVTSPVSCGQNVQPTNIFIKPNKAPITYKYIGAQFTIAKNMSPNAALVAGGNAVTNTDGINTNTMNLSNDALTRQAKNSDWGAATVLSASGYGVYGNNNVMSGWDKNQRKVYNNGYYNNGASSNSNTNYRYTTGCGPISSKSDTYEATCNTYETTTGQEASTTGNVYGIYDLAGGAWEYTQANRGGISSTTYMATMSQPANFNRYDVPPFGAQATWSSSTTEYYYNFDNCLFETCGGHSLHEMRTRQAVSSYTQSWGSDALSSFVYSSDPWFIRGGYSDYGSYAGLWHSNGDSGNSNYNFGFRVVLGKF